MESVEIGKKMELSIPSVMGSEKVAIEYAASVAKMMQFPPERIEDLKTAVAEACMNAIEHGNKMDANTKVGISFTVEDSRLKVVVQDGGTGVGQIEPPSIEQTMEGKKKFRGWGIFLIKRLVDEVEFETSPGAGNVVRMIIHLQK